MTTASLKSYSQKDLAQMARQGGVHGWHAMRKDQLIKALLTAARTRSEKSRTAKKPAPAARRSTAPHSAKLQNSVARPTAKSAPRATLVRSGNANRGAVNRSAVIHGAVNGSATNGSAVNGSAAHGSAVNGRIASNGSVHARPLNGRVGGNGAAPTRPATNGSSSNHTLIPAKTGSRPVTNQAARPAAPPVKPSNPRVVKHLQQVRAKLDRSKNISTFDVNGKRGPAVRDRIVVMVRDSFWLHVCWELTRQSVERAQAAMGQEWHLSHPALRLLEISEGGATNASERVVEDITIHGGVSNWYLHVSDPPKSYRVEIGYLGTGGKFFALARSNVVTTPTPGTSDAIDEHWAGVAENFDKIYAMSGGYSLEGSSQELQELFEERLRRPMGSPMMTRYGEGIEGLFPGKGNFRLEVDAELIVFGNTEPNSHVSLRGEPVRLRPDGSFTVRISLPNQRQVIPVVASAANGGEQRTIVLALERNTKVMEPVVRESND